MISIRQFLLDNDVVVENIYLDKYVELIDANRSRPYIKYKTNKHHIIPRSFYKLTNAVIDNSEQNIVNLLYKDHALAHYYFALCTSNEKLRWDSEYSLRYILNNPNFKCSDNYEQEQELIKSLEEYQILYEELKHHIGDIHRGKKLSAEHRKKLSNANKGKKKSIETRCKMSKARIGLHLSDSAKEKLSIINTGKRLFEETKQKISDNAKNNPNFGMRGKKLSDATKEIISKKSREQWASEENRMEQSNKQKKRKFHWYTNGVDNIQVNEGDEVPDGFYRGKYVSEDTKQKNSNSHKGRDAWNKGKALTEEHKQHLRKPKKKKGEN